MPAGPCLLFCPYLTSSEQKGPDATPDLQRPTGASDTLCGSASLPLALGRPRPQDGSLCPSDDLVEKAPCSWNSSRICECRPGLYCVTSAANSCARCQPRPACPPGTVNRSPGKAPLAAQDPDVDCAAAPPAALTCSLHPAGPSGLPWQCPRAPCIQHPHCSCPHFVPWATQVSFPMGCVTSGGS